MRKFLRRLHLRHFLFLLMLLSGIVPLAVSSLLLMQQNRTILETQERSYLTRSAQTLSVELSEYLAEVRHQLTLLGNAIVAAPSNRRPEDRVGERWTSDFLGDFAMANPQIAALRLLNQGGLGPQLAAEGLADALSGSLDWAFEEARNTAKPSYRFMVLPEGSFPVAVVAIPVADREGRVRLYAEAAVHLEPMEQLFDQEAQGDVAVFLVSRDGDMLWSGGADPVTVRAVQASQLVQDFVASPLNMTQEYDIHVGSRVERMLARVSLVPETGWGIVVHKPAAGAYTSVQEMVFKTAISSGILLLVSLLVAGIAARWISLPMQRLADTASEMAAGNFGERMSGAHLGVVELGELAESFNRMSQTVESYIDRLQKAVQLNRELFIGTLKAFAATIDAKDPYTRGHSERVAGYARAIALHMGLDHEMQERLWVGALMHDVGKIGVEDRILRKVERLTDEEFEEMKLHPVIGAKIMSRIEQLREMIPAIRWHHEAWNGSGYPDGLEGDQIPLIARIVAVADTLDAVTTERPYQKAFTPDFAVQRITELAGRRFDAKVVSAFLDAVNAGDITIAGSGTSTTATLEEFEAALAANPL